MTILLNEPVIADVISRLNTTLNGIIDDINTRVTALTDGTQGFTIEHPTQVLDFVPSPAFLTTFPTVGVRDGLSRFEDDNAWGATGVHEIVVVAFLSSPDQRKLAWTLRRYEQAIIRCVASNRQMDDANSGWGLIFDGVEPGPTLGARGDGPQTFMSWVAAQFTVRRDENTP